MPPSRIEFICGACLVDKAVGQALCVIGPMPEASSLVAECDACGFEKRCVGVSDRMPAHAGPVEVTHRVDEGVVGSPVVPLDRQREFGQHVPRPLTERDDPLPGLRLRPVDGAVPGAGAPDVEDMAVYVAWLERDGLPPAQPGQQDELGHLAPHPREACDHYFYVLKGQKMVTCCWCRKSWPVWWER